MTREIRTPAEAVPHTDTIAEFQTRDGKKGKFILDLEPCCTAAECAQIARAYATAFHKEIRANETGCGGIGESAAEWRARFKEWLKG